MIIMSLKKVSVSSGGFLWFACHGSFHDKQNRKGYFDKEYVNAVEENGEVR